MASPTEATGCWGSCMDMFGDTIKIQVKERSEAMISLKSSANKLLDEMGKLRSHMTDKKSELKAKLMEDFRRKPTAVLNDWLKRVQKVGKKVEEFDRQFSGREARGIGGASCSTNEANKTYQAGDGGDGCSCGLCNLLKHWGGRFCSLVKLSGQVADLIGEVGKLMEEGKVIDNLVISEVEGGKETGDIVYMVGNGAQIGLAKVRSLLEDGEVGIISIYGTAGVGKTELLKRIQQECDASGEYKPVILAEVTGTSDLDRLRENPSKIVVDVDVLRKSIGKDLPGSPSGWDAASLKEALRGTRFLLLLENVWVKLDLEEIGIPRPSRHNKCKIVFSTRSMGVGTSMGATGVELSHLTDEEGYEVFRRELKNDGLLDSCEGPARAIVKECHGIPLALRVMAQVMSRTHKRDWADVAEDLHDPRTMFDEGAMEEEEVLKPLKYSYYHLEPKLRPCLLYCSLLDNSMGIDREELIDYWIGEGFFDRKGKAPGMRAARKEGRNAINQLVLACLLRECSGTPSGAGGRLGGEKVRMHGLIRDMAIKISADEFLAHPDCINDEERNGEHWERARRISLIGSNVTCRLPIRNCPNLVTLLLKNCENLTKIPAGFFDKMSELHLLDLSNTKVASLPEGIINLKQLRHLNLSGTNIVSLPVEVGKLNKLSQLNLSYTDELEKIPYEAIVGADREALKTLNLFRSKYHKWVWDARDPERGVGLCDLERLTSKLEELSLSITDYSSFNDLLSSEVAPSTVGLYLQGGFPGFTAECLYKALGRLRLLHIANVLDLKELALKRQWILNLEALVLSSLSVAGVSIAEEETVEAVHRLRRLEISRCDNLKDLSWIRQLGCLRTLSVKHCSKLKEVVACVHCGHVGDGELCFKSNLETIALEGLGKLASLWKCRVQMPCVPSVTIKSCVNLNGELFYYNSQGERNEMQVTRC